MRIARHLVIFNLDLEVSTVVFESGLKHIYKTFLGAKNLKTSSFLQQLNNKLQILTNWHGHIVIKFVKRTYKL